jgi:6-phosphogluconolactonase
MKPRIVYCKNKKEFAKVSGDYIRDLSAECIKKTGRFTIMLPGGSTPETVFEYLALPETQKTIDWRSFFVFWGDERYVPADNPDSNYRMAHRSLLSKVPIQEENIFRVPTEAGTVEEAAKTYEKTLKTFFSKGPMSGGFPVFDLILLGMGRDGHTASLYPDNPALKEFKRWVTAVRAPASAPVRKRISITFPFINSSTRACFLVTGSEKTEIMKDVLKEESLKEKKIPSSMVNPKEEIIWFTDNSKKDILLY